MNQKHYVIAIIAMLLVSGTMIGVTTARYTSLQRTIQSLAQDVTRIKNQQALAQLTGVYSNYMSQQGVGSLQSQAQVCVIGEGDRAIRYCPDVYPASPSNNPSGFNHNSSSVHYQGSASDISAPTHGSSSGHYKSSDVPWWKKWFPFFGIDYDQSSVPESLEQ